MAWGICNVRTSHPSPSRPTANHHVNSMPSTSTVSRAGSRRARSALSTIGIGSSRNMVAEARRTGPMMGKPWEWQELQAPENDGGHDMLTWR